MTLIAGFLCTDGFVIAADTEMTLGSVSFQGNKVTTYDAGSPGTLCVAFAGNVAYAMTASQRIRDAVLRLPDRNLDAMKDAIREVIERIYEEQVFKLWAATGRDYEDDFALIIGIEDSEKRFAVLATHVNSVHEVPYYEFAGSGGQLASYVSERLCSNAPMPTAVTEHLVSQVFREIKNKGFCVGGNTQIVSRRAHAGADKFFTLKVSRDDYRFLWGLDDALLSAVRVAIDHGGHRPTKKGRKLPDRLEKRLAFMRKRLTELYKDSSVERSNGGDERHATEFGTEYGNMFKDM